MLSHMCCQGYDKLIKNINWVGKSSEIEDYIQKTKNKNVHNITKSGCLIRS